MDFYKIRTREIDKGPQKGTFEVYADFVVGRSKDLMVKGRSFYAIWDEEAGLWSTDEYDVQRLVDEHLYSEAARLSESSGVEYTVRSLQSFSNNSWAQFRKFIQNVSDNSHPLDNNLTFQNSIVSKGDFVSRRLNYSLESGDYSSWDELIGTLYSVEQRAKIEWAIGAIVSGDSKNIQKFIVLYGAPGSGKGTVVNVIKKLFDGYTTTFEAKALAGNNNNFATDVFRNNPLVAFQHDGDLSKIEDNTKLNSIISHEEMTMNEKHKPSYSSRINAFLFLGTNKPVKISDAKSGIIRRLIDVHPTGVLIPENRYDILMSKIDFELGAIASHCLEVYRKLGKNHYNSYRPLEMMLQTDVFFNYIEAYYDIFKSQDSTTLKQAYSLYKEYCNETGIDKILPQYKFREELRNYFDEFKERGFSDGAMVRSLYSGFSANRFKAPVKNDLAFSLVLDETVSIFDKEYAECPAQGSKLDEFGNEIPLQMWKFVNTTLGEVDTSTVHFVKVPENMIVIDFDLKDVNGKKSAERNLEAASGWPATYGEFSKGGGGIHLHYFYDGDISMLNRNYSDGIEVKTFSGNASLRRRLTKCNNVPIANISDRLPLKEKKMLGEATIKSEKGLRDLIDRNLRKEIHSGTKPSVDFIKKILDDAYESGMVYDVGDMRSKIVAFANNSTNQAMNCLKTVKEMKFVGQVSFEEVESVEKKSEELVLFDVEVFPNLFVVCWKYRGDPNVVKMINPTPSEIEDLFNLKLVGFYNRRYDNHILYARHLGYSNEQLFKLSQRIIANERSAYFGEAYNVSYADIYDFSSKKQTLKRFQIDLGIHHVEIDIPWDQPVPDELIPKVVEYCVNDVISTEAVLEDREQDLVARKILSDLSGLSVNATTQQHTAKIIFEGDRYPQRSFVYTDLSTRFPGYVFDAGKSQYKGEDPSEGGYVYSEPGMYENVAVLDVASMHPTSIVQMNTFGEYTHNFEDLLKARLAIKHKDFAQARKMLGGKLSPYLNDESKAKELSYALKIVINIVYGLTSAKFDNPFRDIRNKDNIVAKRGALFMIDMKEYVQQELGLQVVHIKTDSIKVVNPSEEQIEKMVKFGHSYGYDFEHESTYDKFCLVNDAVYIAKEIIPAEVEGDNKDAWKVKWEAVGAQFAHPYVYKTLFAKDQVVTFDDLCEAKSVTQGAMYLDFDHDQAMALKEREIPGNMKFIGKSGRFVPVMPEAGGAVLYRVRDGKAYAVTGTKGYLWLEAEMVEVSDDFNKDQDIDMSYFDNLVRDAVSNIEKHGSFEEFIK